jgi:hypothetical protein
MASRFALFGDGNFPDASPWGGAVSVSMPACREEVKEPTLRQSPTQKDTLSNLRCYAAAAGPLLRWSQVALSF